MKPELTLRRALSACGFRLNSRAVHGLPELFLPKHRAVVFVHFCSWHRHEGCRYSTAPSSREEVYSAKFTANLARDAAARDKLLESGGRIVAVWECAFRKPDQVNASADLLS